MNEAITRAIVALDEAKAEFARTVQSIQLKCPHTVLSEGHGYGRILRVCEHCGLSEHPSAAYSSYAPATAYTVLVGRAYPASYDDVLKLSVGEAVSSTNAALSFESP